jgi:rhodanese-related sulfurtransferase
MQDLIKEAKQNIIEIEPSKAKEIINNSTVIVIDVREEHEYNEGHLENAILLPRGELEFKIGSLSELADKSAAIIVYCGSGNRAALSANTLNQMGYTNVMSIAGGFQAWKQLN